MTTWMILINRKMRFQPQVARVIWINAGMFGWMKFELLRRGNSFYGKVAPHRLRMSKSMCRLQGERLVVLFGFYLRDDVNTYTSRSVGVALGLPSLFYSAGWFRCFVAKYQLYHWLRHPYQFVTNSL